VKCDALSRAGAAVESGTDADDSGQADRRGETGGVVWLRARWGKKRGKRTGDIQDQTRTAAQETRQASRHKTECGGSWG
jgi:hypothetical protein